MPLLFPGGVSPLRIVVLISGGGTTLRNLIDQIAAGRLDVRIEAVVSSSAAAFGLKYAQAAEIPTAIIDPKGFPTRAAFSETVFDRCRAADPHLVSMGGWLKLLDIPPEFDHRVVNIHPALIPAFCGHGFYGRRVHEAVLEYGAKVSGCTVHLVDCEYDHGPIVLQRVVPVLDDDTSRSLAARVFAAECEALPAALRLLASGRVHIDGRAVQIR